MVVFVLFLIGAAGIAILDYGISETSKTKEVLRRMTKKSRLPKSLGAMVGIADLTQLGHTIGHITLVGVFVTLILFTIFLAVNSETDGEMY